MLLVGVPVVAQWKGIQLGTRRLQVWSLAALSGLRIRRSGELWCRLQTQLGSGVAVAVAQASGYSSDSIPSLGTSTCCGCGPKKQSINQSINQSMPHGNCILLGRWLKNVSYLYFGLICHFIFIQWKRNLTITFFFFLKICPRQSLQNRLVDI